MGKSAPTPPPAPDPTVVANAQTQSNKDTANYQSTLNNTNQVTPYGAVTYTQAPSGQWTQTVSASPAEQQVINQSLQAQNGALGIADQQIGRVGSALGQSLAVPSFQTGAPIGSLVSGYDPGGQIQTSVAPTYSPFGGMMGFGSSSGQPQGQPSTGGQYSIAQTPVSAPTQASSPATPTNMKYDSSSGWIPSVPYGVDTTGAHPGMMYDPSRGWVTADSRAVSPSQTQTASQPAAGQAAAQQASLPGAQTSPASVSASTPGFNTFSAGHGTPYTAQIPSDLASAIASNPVLGTQLASYQQATSALDPQWQQNAEQQQAQLIAQGLNPNDAAYQNSMTLFDQAKNNAYNQALWGAIGAGDTEQQALYGQNLSSAQFANQSQAQQNSENAAQAAFNNAAYGQNYNEQYQNAQLANSANQQGFQDTSYAQELPINELTALMGSGQVQLPTSAPAQTSVAPTNVLGAYGLQQTALQNTYDAQMQNQQSGLGGLFNLGSAAMKLFPI